MTVTVTIMNNTPERHTGYVPKLRYRNAVPTELAESADENKEVVSPTRIPPASSIREIRESLPRSPTTLSNRPIPQQPVQQRRKGSMFSGLFVKEPSMAALDMVSAQMMDKHGKVSPTTVPYVSSTKMPQHVPKVNSKWDGVPEAVKMKEKERQRAATRNSLRPSMPNTSRSTEEPVGKPSARKLSNSDSWDSRSSGSRPTFQDNPTRPDSLYSTDSGNSNKSSKQKLPTRPQSYRTPSGSSLPEITAFFPNDIPETRKAPQRCMSTTSSNTHFTGSSDRTGMSRPKSDVSTVLTDPIPEHSASPFTTPIDDSPQTPFPLSDDENMDVSMKRRGVVAPAKLNIQSAMVKSKRVSMQPIDAFLAGEANPLEISSSDDSDEDHRTITALPVRKKSSTTRHPQAAPIGLVQQSLERRPDSSRARLGLRASMVLPESGTPWESQEIANTPIRTPTSPTSPRGKFRLFKKDDL